MNNIGPYVAYVRKAIIQIATLIIVLGTAVATYTQLPDKYAAIITASVGVAGSVLHFMVSNAPAPGTVSAVEEFDPSESEEGDDTDFSTEELTALPPEVHVGQHRLEDPSTQQ